MARPLPTSLTFFFPAYNEEGNVRPMVERALAVLPRFAADFEVVIVDDGSRDGTEAEARALVEADPRVRYVRHETNRGYGEAIRSGLKAATKAAVCYTDGDQQFDLDDLDRLWPLLAEADLVAGYRIRRADPPHRRFIAFTYNRLLRLLFGLRTRDVDCAFKLLRAEVAGEIDPASGGAFFSAEFLLRAKHRGHLIREVGVRHFPRRLGKPKGATPAVILRTFREMFALRRQLREGGRTGAGRDR
ncbi:MAG TPA: glycosyltransferase family 2 protein [Candidatus Dormibacteraeota bacterium]|jgi:glycosyltransferase involved in cell wall biosynthesis|nr:glycosyltransferase family 2 protein [Candidatus Dormibacteraeota bacterium]